MSKEYRSVSFGFTVLDYENLPEKNGEQMYADGVVDEVWDVVDQALKAWYSERGHELLAGEPV